MEKTASSPFKVSSPFQMGQQNQGKPVNLFSPVNFGQNDRLSSLSPDNVITGQISIFPKYFLIKI